VAEALEVTVIDSTMKITGTDLRYYQSIFYTVAEALEATDVDCTMRIIYHRNGLLINFQ